MAELLTEQGDMPGRCTGPRPASGCLGGVLGRSGDRTELRLLLSLRYRLRIDLGLPEDDYDKMLDMTRETPRAGPAAGG